MKNPKQCVYIKNNAYFCRQIINNCFDMKKGISFIVLIFIVLAQASCNKTPTYEEMKAAEKKLINRILAEKNIEVLDEYPESGVFGENQFVELSTGIYLNVVDSGNGNRAVYNETVVLVRASGSYYEMEETTNFNTFLNTYPPFEFRYGRASTVVSEHASTYDMYYMVFSAGLESILEYVGENAIVKLIVPGYAEINSGGSYYSVGSTFQTSGMRNTFVPIYYDRVRYTYY